MAAVEKGFVLDWLNFLASGPAEAWRDCVADDVVIRLPFAPPGVTSEMRGINQALAVMAAHWDSIERFDWCDIVIHRAEDPDLFVTTARSDVMFRSGVSYSNDYVILTRTKDGRVTEHTEYFNPLPVVQMLDPA